MANEQREALLQKAQKIGLIIEVDFQKNISNANLEKLIDEKKQLLQGNQNDNTTNEQENETPLDKTIIERTSKCGNYKAKIVGIEETARRSGLTVEEVEECLESGVASSSGWKFKKI